MNANCICYSFLALALQALKQHVMINEVNFVLFSIVSLECMLIFNDILLIAKVVTNRLNGQPAVYARLSYML